MTIYTIYWHTLRFWGLIGQNEFTTEMLQFEVLFLAIFLQLIYRNGILQV